MNFFTKLHQNSETIAIFCTLLDMQCLSLKVDYAFKKLFVTEPSLLVDFLNSVFDGYTDWKIQSLEILNPELPGASIEDKAAVLDIRAVDTKGRRFYIEMQANSIQPFLNRTAFYAFRLYTDGLSKGERHTKLAPVYSINLLDGTLFPGDSYHRFFRLLDIREPSIQMTKDLEFHFIEMPKLHKALSDINGPLEAWSYFIRESDHLSEADMADLAKKHAPLEKAEDVLTEISQDKSSRLEYDLRQMALRTYEIALNEKLLEGQTKKAQAAARTLRKAGVTPGLIAEATGLSLEEIERL